MDRKDKKYMIDFGSRVKDRRSELKMTQAELSKKINYTIPAISMIENGKRNCNQTEIAKLAKALDCTAAYLMGWEDINGKEETTSEEISTEAVYNYLVRCGFLEADEDLSDADLQFIEAQLASIALWFKNKKDSRK